MKTLVGIRPTGRLHIGHYFSVIKPALEEGADVLVATYHAPEYYPKMVSELKKYIPDQQIKLQEDLFDPSLYFHLLSLTSDGELRRMTQYKSSKKPTAHLYVYPVLMACDVVGYDRVIVGEDQRQHLEFARRLLSRTMDKDQIPVGDYRGGRVMSLANPAKKMSKSDPKGCLFLDEDPLPKLMKAVTTIEGTNNLSQLAEMIGVNYDPANNEESKKRLAEAITNLNEEKKGEE